MSLDHTGFELAPSIVQDMEYAQKSFAEAAANLNLSLQDRIVAAGQWLEGIAGISMADVTPDMTHSPSTDQLKESIALLDSDELVLAGEELLQHLCLLLEDPEQETILDSFRVPIEHGLLFRQSFSRRPQGLGMCAGKHAELSKEQSEAVQIFDCSLRPMAWALTFMNDIREGHCLLMAPKYRKNHWWWSECLDLQWPGVVYAHDTAGMVARYPEFENWFDRLRHADQLSRGQFDKEVLSSLGQKDYQLVAHSYPEDERSRRIYSLSEHSAVFYRHASEGFVLRVMIIPPDSVTGQMRVEFEDGRKLPCVLSGRSWICPLGETLPARVKLQLNLNGEEKNEVIRFE